MTLRMLFGAAVAAAALAMPGVSVAQTPAVQDSVVLTGGFAQAGPFVVAEIGVTSGPSGENPTGQVSFLVQGSFQVSGPVTCLAVRGSTATINIRDPSFGIVTVEVIDNQPDSFNAAPVSRAPTDCSLPTGWTPISLSSGDITVVDAQPLPTKKDQCKNGGWRKYGSTFKNEGQCVAFVQRPTKP
jgi:hypothetical protein